jgi:hypothetical protein
VYVVIARLPLNCQEVTKIELVMRPDTKPHLDRARFEGDYPAVGAIVERLQELTQDSCSD